jgi:hypothetical protein
MSAYNYAEISKLLQNIKNPDFNRSEQLAVKNGFEVVYDKDAYNGRYFIKDGKKWIHNIDALKRQLRKDSDSELSEYDYDVVAYYETH